MKFSKICVLGLGYIGLPTASTFAAHDVQVIGVDVNAEVVKCLQGGEVHIHEPGLRTIFQSALRSGRLILETHPQPADAFIIAVPTPFKEGKKADLSYVISAAESIVPHLRRGNLVVLESTSPPQTTTGVVLPILEQSGLKAGEDFYLAYSPERVLPGQILRELIENARIVGGINSASAEAGCDLYSIFVKGQIILTDATTAEMVKLMENTFRDVNIALANEFSRLADRFGVDVWEAVSLANRHPRVNILSPGPGVGGHCISVDPWFLVEAAPDITPLIRTAREVNDQQPGFAFALVKRALGGSVEGKRIAALGLSYKPDVDDLRESPAIETCHLLVNAGAVVSAFEPFKPGASVPGIELCPSFEKAAENADALLLLVKHTPLRELKPSEVSKLTKARVVIDCVSGWGQALWEAEGFEYHRLGVGKSE
ncbi:MAG: nucleotide sugar dehydrogenase [Chloroflexi bacterium]|nr:nucleotide sugar dehydrogenase [Chloroflexota bacterium]